MFFSPPLSSVTSLFVHYQTYHRANKKKDRVSTSAIIAAKIEVSIKKTIIVQYGADQYHHNSSFILESARTLIGAALCLFFLLCWSSNSVTSGSTCDTSNKTKKLFLQLMNPAGTHKFEWLHLFEGLYYFFQQKWNWPAANTINLGLFSLGAWGLWSGEQWEGARKRETWKLRRRGWNEEVGDVLTHSIREAADWAARRVRKTTTWPPHHLLASDSLPLSWHCEESHAARSLTFDQSRHAPF